MALRNRWALLPTWRELPGLPARITAGLVAAFLVTGCVGPSRTDTDFRHKVANTAETISGIIGTVQVALMAVARNGVPAPYLSVTIADADDDASAVVGTFDSVQPPSEQADDLRSKLDDVLQQAVSTLDDLRIAVRRGELQELPQRAGSLASLRERLQQLMDVA